MWIKHVYEICKSFNSFFIYILHSVATVLELGLRLKVLVFQSFHICLILRSPCLLHIYSWQVSSRSTCLANLRPFWLFSTNFCHMIVFFQRHHSVCVCVYFCYPDGEVGSTCWHCAKSKSACQSAHAKSYIISLHQSPKTHAHMHRRTHGRSITVCSTQRNFFSMGTCLGWRGKERIREKNLRTKSRRNLFHIHNTLIHLCHLQIKQAMKITSSKLGLMVKVT